MATTPTSERNADEGIQQFDFFGSNPNNPQPIPPSETGGVPAPVTETESPASSSEATGDNQTNTGTEPKHDPSRYEYWQREASLLRSELDQVKPFVPVARYVLENPQLLQTIEQDLKQKKAGPQGPPQLPKEPERPAEYSEEAAYSDPSSASFKYRVALDRHNSAKLDYLIKAQEYEKAQRETVLKQQQQQEQEYRVVVRFRDIRMMVQVLIIAFYVIIIDLLLKAYRPDMSRQLGPYVVLIITNCIVMGRCEAFAGSNKPWPSFLDGFVSGVGYSFVLLAIAAFRELLGMGTIMGFAVPYFSTHWDKWIIMVMPPDAGFFVLAMVMWLCRSVDVKGSKK